MTGEAHVDTCHGAQYTALYNALPLTVADHNTLTRSPSVKWLSLILTRSNQCPKSTFGNSYSVYLSIAYGVSGQ